MSQVLSSNILVVAVGQIIETSDGLEISNVVPIPFVGYECYQTELRGWGYSEFSPPKNPHNLQNYLRQVTPEYWTHPDDGIAVIFSTWEELKPNEAEGFQSFLEYIMIEMEERMS